MPTNKKDIVGTVVGVTKPSEFYFTITPGRVQLQDLVAVDAFKIDSTGENQKDTFRVWAKVVEIERINPLFPEEAAQELSFQGISAFDTVISLSREMITAKCSVLGKESDSAKIEPLTYPLQPASSVYIAPKEDVEKVITGDLESHRKLHLGHLRSRSEFAVYVDAHAIVARHLAILAATGAGKTVATRRVIEELFKQKYPVLIFDSHADYIGLQNVFPEKVVIYNPTIDLVQEENDSIIDFVSALSGESVEGPQADFLNRMIESLKNQVVRDALRQLSNRIGGQSLPELDLSAKHFWALMGLGQLLLYKLKQDTQNWPTTHQPWLAQNAPQLATFDSRIVGPLIRKCNRAGKQFYAMQKANRALSSKLKTKPLPSGENSKELISLDHISIVNFEGYSDEIRRGLVASILGQLIEDRIDDNIPRFLTVVEESHNFIPSRMEGEKDVPSLPVIRRIATEGRKYGMGLILISQRPYRVDPTILSQCNS
ncbi:MAG: ATP-binding protein, partial [Ignavibacteriae bacterium]|nr:ATP-binding protein [Ignavibacteriota bacterium]